jgi:hypothetical protein
MEPVLQKRINFKIPPHFMAEIHTKPLFFKITKIHHYYVDLFQCALMLKFSHVNNDCDRGGDMAPR